ncbi:MAG: non-hydrolyzing UDP-N-acetylglucosamine 2-epimerase [Lysobacterales bacterium]
MLVYGTRPEAIKLAPVARELRRCKVATQQIDTGQHPAMVGEVERLFEIEGALKLQTPNRGDPNQFFTDASQRLSSAFREAGATQVVVQGDTASAFAAAQVGFLEGIPVHHVEAGLRSGDMTQPFPEEYFRRAISLVATRHYTPTPRATQHLVDEGIHPDAIHETGNTIVDALKWVIDHTEADLRGQYESRPPFVLMTAHRRENRGGGFHQICRAVQRVRANGGPEFLWPLHPSPEVRQPVEAVLGEVDGVHLVPPMNYKEFLSALNGCCQLWTDSGGIQEEAGSLGKPVVILREVTERPEVVEAGLGVLAGTDEDAIIAASDSFFQAPPGAAVTSPFGDGQAAKRIVADLR